MVSVIPTADSKLFYRRLKRVYDVWDDLIKVDTIIVPVGQCDKIEYCKSTSIQEWLFNMEIPDTLMIFGKNHIFFMATKKKIDFLRPLQDKVPPGTNLPKVTLLVRNKLDSNKENFDTILDAMKKCKTAGVFVKDNFPGEFYEECITKIFKGEASLEKQDVTASIAYVLAVKEDIELQLIQKACNATETTYSAVLCKELTAIIDKERKIPHKKLASKLDDLISKDARRYLTGLDSNLVETCYVPILQSGGNYSLRFAAESDDENIHYGIIVSSLGLRYKRYCSNISRTLMVEPTAQQGENYEFLLRVSDEIIKRLTDGVMLSDLYQEIVDFVKAEKPEFVDKLTKNFGFVTGIEFREGSLVIGPKTKFRARKNMSFIISVGFSDLINNDATDPIAKKYALFVSDTVVVNDAGQPANLLTQKKRKFNKTKILIRQDDESEAEEQHSNDAIDVDDAIITESLREGSRRRVMSDRLRTDAPNSDDRRRREHQRELLQQVNEAAKKRLSKKSAEVTETRVKKSIIAYKSIKDFPKENEISDLKIYVDKQHETIILPIFGVPVPFHISTIKNVSTSVEGDYLYLRINFFFPGSTLEKGSIFPTNEATFLKELTYRSYALKEQGEVNSPAQNLNESFVSIKTVQKKFKSRVDEEKELEGVVKQDSLQISANKNNPKLKDLFIRPNIYPRRISGTLEAHKNGFRFISIKNDKVDIMFNNIKHAIYQPCDGEMIILVHFNLKNPIMLNKKRHYDIQFYTEVGEITTDLGKRQHMHDREDLAAEAAERNLRTNLKKAFKVFCDKVEQATSGAIQFDIPLRDLGFYGVPKKSNVLLQPTPNALINITDPDPTVITLSEIELVHFERVSFQLKNFDMVIVFKDYNVKPQSIAAVEMSKLEDIKNWLDRCDIAFTSGSSNLNWPAIMRMITTKIDDFFEEQGGWAFLSSDAEDDDGDEDEEEEEDEVYDPSEDDTEEDEEDTDISEEESDDEYGDSDASEDVNSSEESGKDWSELEEEAAQADRTNNYDDSNSHRRSNGTAKRKSYDDGRGGGGKKRR